MGLPASVIALAYKIRGSRESVVRGANEVSKYNPNVIVRCCAICRSRENLTVHHIERQCDGGGDEEGNLVTLCKECHDRVDRVGDYVIDGWVTNSRGERHLKWRQRETVEEIEAAREGGEVPIGRNRYTGEMRDEVLELYRRGWADKVIQRHMRGK